MPEILIVEDNADIAELLRRRLERLDYEVEIACDDQEFFQVLEEFTPNLILMDLDLGKFSKNGWELNRYLKETEQYQQLPVIVLTAHGQWVEARERAEQEGFVDHVRKPIDNDELMQKIATHLKPSD